MAGLIDKLLGATVAKYGFALERQTSVAGLGYEAAGMQQLSQVKSIGKSNSIDDILTAEFYLMALERENLANSPAMRRSLDMAVAEIKILQKMVERVREPETYQKIDLDHERPKDRTGPLPNDSGRQIFRSHLARLLNQDKAPLDLIDKKIIDARRANMRVAEKAYIALQHTALGIAPAPPNKRRGQGMGL